MSLYLILPSVSAIAIKIVLLISFRERFINSSRWVRLLLSSLFFMNCIELSGFYFADKIEHPLTLPFLSLYYIFAVFAVWSLYFISADAAEQEAKVFRRIALFLMLLCTILVAIPGVAISGASSMGYTVTRVPGPLYPIIPMSALLILTVTLFTLVKNSISPAKASHARPVRVLMIAVAPLVAVIGFVILLMLAGVKINLSIFASTLTNWLVLVFLITQTSTSQFVFLGFMPFTRENRYLIDLAKHVASSNKSCKEGKDLFEKGRLVEFLSATDGNITEAADRLNMSRSTVYKKLEKVGLRERATESPSSPVSAKSSNPCTSNR